MTALLQEVFQKASVLPEVVQNMLARELLQETEWENQWDQWFGNFFCCVTQ